METIDLIKTSLQEYIKQQRGDNKALFSVVMNFSDMQGSLVKAYHTATLKAVLVEIVENKAVMSPLLEDSLVYNHGVTARQEVEDKVCCSFMAKLYGKIARKEI